MTHKEELISQYGTIIDTIELGRRINALQCWLGISTDILAERIGYAEGSIANWKYQKYYPSLQTVEDMAKVFGISGQELIRPEGCELITKAMRHTAQGKYIIFSPKKVCGLIKAHGMGLNAAAKTFGTDYFHKSKSGSRYTYYKNLSKVAETFGVSMEELCN